MNSKTPLGSSHQSIEDQVVSVADIQSPDYELSCATDHEAVEMLERAGHVSSLRSQINGSSHVPTSQVISDTIGHLVDSNRFVEPTIDN